MSVRRKFDGGQQIRLLQGLTPTQRGTAGEQLFAACVTLSWAGDLELFKPLTDDDHTDVTAGRHGSVPALARQVKTALTLDRQGFAVARMSFPERRARQHRIRVPGAHMLLRRQ